MLLALLPPASGCGAAHVHLSVTPASSLADEPFTVQASRLRPRRPVTPTGRELAWPRLLRFLREASR